MTVRLLEFLDRVTDKTGQILSVLPLVLILTQFAIVIGLYIFSEGNIMLQESLQYINAVMFLGAAGYTALKNEHVRVDLVYSGLGERGKAWVNLGGTLFLLVPFLILLWSTAIPYVASSWEILEKSVETSGLPFVYLLKSTILLFTMSLSLTALTDIIRNASFLFGVKR